MPIEKLLLKLRARDDISPKEETALRDAVGELREHPADRVIIREGQELTTSTLLLERPPLAVFHDRVSPEAAAR